MRKQMILWTAMVVMALSAVVQAELEMVDNLEGYAAVTGQSIDTKIPNGVLGGFWDTSSEGPTSTASKQCGSPSNLSGNIVLLCKTPTSGVAVGSCFSGISNPVNNDEIGTMFCRFMVQDNNPNAVGVHFGFHANTGTNPMTNGVLSQIVAGFAAYKVTSAATDPYDITTINRTQVLKTGLTRNTWYNAWIVADNSTDKFDLYISQAAGPAGDPGLPTSADLVGSGLSFNAATANPLTGGMVIQQQVAGTGNQTPFANFDEFWWDGSNGLNLVTKAARNPVPVSGSTKISLTPTLSWDAPNDPNVVSVQEYKVYLDPNQANVANGTSMVVNSQPDTDLDYAPATLQYNTTYYWRVETTETVNDGNSPAIIPGSIWNFKTIPATPVVDTQPVSTAVNPGSPAQMTVAVSSVTAVTYQWYKSVDNSNATIIDDVMVGTNSNVLDIASASKTDEGYYYCTATNEGGSTSSAVAKLGVFRQVAYWTLDSANYADNQYKDTSGEGHHADPNGVPTFVAGKFADGVAMDPQGYATAGTWNPSEFTGKFTVSAWVKWNGQPTTPVWQGITGKKNFGTGGSTTWALELQNNAAGTIQFKGGATISSSTQLTAGEWMQIIATYDGASASGSKIYLNGLQTASGNINLGATTTNTVCIGTDAYDPALDAFESGFNGVIDDVKFYNYGVNAIQAATMYYNDSGIPVCLSTTKPAYDYDNNCTVDLGDFITFAKDWLDCGLVPECVTQ